MPRGGKHEDDFVLGYTGYTKGLDGWIDEIGK
jgi:hypothetical protein